VKRLLGLVAVLLGLVGFAACEPPAPPSTTTTTSTSSTTSTSTTTTSTSTTTTSSTTTTTVVPPPTWPTHGTSGGVAHTYFGTGPTVDIIGDSLTVMDWDDLYTDLSPDHSVKVAGWFGEGWSGGPFTDRTGVFFAQSVVDEYAADDPDVVVLALGTNDVWHDGAHVDDPVLASTTEHAAVDAFAGSCIVWVTLPDVPGAANWDPVEAQTMNADAATWADQTADWAGAVTADPTLLNAGHVHATAAGYLVRAQLIDDAVGRCVLN
jgi:hypothetical protein